MNKSIKQIIVQGTKISLLLRPNNNDHISLTDMAKKFGDDVLVYQWMRNRNTVEFLGIWERLHNPDFKGIEFETFKKQAGMNSFSLTPKKWIEATNAIGVLSKQGDMEAELMLTSILPLNLALGYRLNSSCI